MSTLLIINPKAGRRKSDPLPAIRAALQSDLDLKVHPTTGPGDATSAARQAASEGFDLVIAAGGDGSVNEVANGLVGTRTALGIIPVGTENVLAREVGIPLEPALACRHLLNCPNRAIDTGRVENHHFVCFAGIGFDAYVAHRLSPKRKRALGGLAYALTSLEKIGTYTKTARRAHLEVDGESLEFDPWMVLISNIRTYGGGLTPAPKAVLDDGLLDLCVFPSGSYGQLGQQMLATRTGKHLSLPGMFTRQAKQIVLKTDPPEQIQLDGDPWARTTPVTIEVVPGSLLARF